MTDATPRDPRGDVVVDIGGVEVTLRPTWEVIKEIERQLGHGLLALFRRFAAGTYTMTELVEIVRIASKGSGTELPSDLGERMTAAGLYTYFDPICLLLQNGIDGGTAAEKKAKPGAPG